MFGKGWSPKGQHCYVTGASSGLGFCLAQELTKAGAHVSIVARGEARLATALADLETLRVDSSQILKSYSFPLDTSAKSAEAIEAAASAHRGRCPDAFFLCAGASKPMFCVETSEQDYIDGMTSGYWVQAWSALAATKKMIQAGVKGKVVLVGSTLSYMSFVGYASYSPAKHALRGLADTLRSEMLLYDISVHMYFPNTMHTPGYDVEMLTKPAITAKIEEGDTPVTPANAAKALLRGVERGEFHISGDLITSLFRSSTRGAAPYSNTALTVLHDIIALIGVPLWRRSTDSKIRGHKAEHKKYLQDKGIIQDPRK